MTPGALARRVSVPEKLDAPQHDPESLRRNLKHLAGVSRWLGGERSIARHIRHVWETPVRPRIVLDVGAGGADLSKRLLLRFGTRYGETLHLAMDRQPAVARIAAAGLSPDQPVRVVIGDGVSIPPADRSVDVALSSTTLHHLDTPVAVRFVGELARVAREIVVVGDLERHLLALFGAHILARTWWRRSPYRFDGPISIRRSFTADELLDVGREAGLSNARVYRHFPFRLTLVGSPC